MLVIDHHKVSRLKQHSSIISASVNQKSGHSLVGFSAQGLRRLKSHPEGSVPSLQSLLSKLVDQLHLQETIPLYQMSSSL